MMNLLLNVICLILFMFIFDTGHYDKCVAKLREKNKDDMATVMAAIFAHSQVAQRNQVIISLVVCNYEYISYQN